MKNNTLNILLTICIILSVSIFQTGFAQDGSAIVKEVRELPEFSGIDVGGAFSVYLEQGEEQKVILETNTKFLEKVFTKVDNGILKITSKSLKNPSRLNLYITLKELDLIWISGAADIEGEGVFISKKLNIESSGASSLQLEVNAGEIMIVSSGASDVVLNGNANKLTARASGAASIDGAGLKTVDAKAEASGASDINIIASNNIIIKTSGAGSVTHNKTSKTVKLYKEPSKVHYVEIDSRNYRDTTRVKVGSVYVEVVEDDSVTITVGNRVLIVNEDGNVKIKHRKKRKFNGHWGGFGLSINGYVNKDFNMQFPKEDEYMDLRMEKSIGVYFNLFEQNIAFTRNKKFGLVTGLGIETHNYRFLHQTTLSTQSSQLEGFIDTGISVRKSKLVVNYFTLPIILEWQTNQNQKWKRFHINAGVIIGARFASHTKKYYNELNKHYYLTQYDPDLGHYLAKFETISPGTNKTHNRGDFYLNPFKVDATFGIGIGIINLFANFGLTTLYRENKAPELYTWSAGIILVGW
ncbi:MAG: DUF2807 domain-containing protein [Bacteroidota bacterium]|nr:DUF2807 domain-containing protein [Bacteroidota bacterium]